MRCGMGLRKINAVLITHWHFEHWIGLVDLHAWDRKATRAERPKYTIIMNSHTFERYTAVLERFIEATNYWLKSRYEIRVVGKYDKLRLGGDVEIRAVPLDHTVPTTGYLIYTPDACIGYLVDTGIGIEDRALDLIGECKDYIVLDVTWHRRFGQGHMSIDDAAKFVKLVKPRRAFATHIGHRNLPHGQLAEVLSRKTGGVLRPSYDGLTINI